MQQAVWSVNGNLPVADVSTMQDIYSDSMARTSFTLVMLAIAGTMALALGILGIYGVISYAVSQRTREIGIRMALGAKKSELVWMFVRSALVLTGIGTAVGLGAAAALMRLMRTLLFGISPLDPVTFTGRAGRCWPRRRWRAICRRGARLRSIRWKRCARNSAIRLCSKHHDDENRVIATRWLGQAGCCDRCVDAGACR